MDNMPKQRVSSSIEDFVEPVWQKLQKFNPGANYQREDIKNTLRGLTKSGAIPNVALLPDQKSINPIPAESNAYKLLIARCCKVYVNLICSRRQIHVGDDVRSL